MAPPAALGPNLTSEPLQFARKASGVTVDGHVSASRERGLSRDPIIARIEVNLLLKNAALAGAVGAAAMLPPALPLLLTAVDAAATGERRNWDSSIVILP